MRFPVAILALVFVPSLAYADDSPTAPVSAWIVTGGDPSTVKITQLGDTSLGIVVGWKCVASLSTSTARGKRVDAMMVSCVKGDLMVRAGAKHVEGTPADDETILQISAPDGSKVARTIVFGPV